VKTIVYIGASLDGFIARSNGDLGWLVPFENDEVRERYSEFMRTIDSVVIGRGTFEKVLAFPSWPYEKPVFVLSSSLKSVPALARGKVTILSMAPQELLAHLSRMNFSTIYVDGGRAIQSFFKADCIDEMIITRVPVLLGSGIPLFGALEHELQFMHVHSATYSNGLVTSRYDRKRE
jgi:dihydrofolate reductase